MIYQLQWLVAHQQIFPEPQNPSKVKEWKPVMKTRISWSPQKIKPYSLFNDEMHAQEIMVVEIAMMLYELMNTSTMMIPCMH